MLELGPHKDRENSDQCGIGTHDLRNSITVASPTELPGENGNDMLVFEILFHMDKCGSAQA